jgi:hypothetical protein
MSMAYVYVLPLSGADDWLKLGRSNNPLRRAQQFGRRYYELFDLTQSFLVEVESVRDAVAVERSLRVCLRDHKSVQPLLVQPAAGGKTEWLRGAHGSLRLAVQALSDSGHRVHVPALAWFRDALQSRLSDLHPWTSSVWRACQLDPYSGIDVTLPDDVASLVRDHLDGFAALGLEIAAELPASVRRWYRRDSADGFIGK